MDKTLVCRECGQEFLFTAGEQDFYASRGFTNAPSRCPACRAARRSERGISPGGHSREHRELHPAVCARCGSATRVPFVPRGDRPVYCSDCFERQRAYR